MFHVNENLQANFTDGDQSFLAAAAALWDELPGDNWRHRFPDAHCFPSAAQQIYLFVFFVSFSITFIGTASLDYKALRV